MENKTPRIYTYKITFEETRHYYYGSHKEKRFGEYYMGSPKTHKWMWDFYTPQKQVLELFDFTDEGYKEARQIEDRLIRPVYNTDPLCLNEHCGGNYSLEVRRKGGKLTGKINGQRAYENKTGIYRMTQEQKIESRRKGGKKSKENGTGLFKLTLDQRKEFGRKGGKKSKENGTGFFKLPLDQRKENSRKGGKNTKSQKWQCTVTGHVSNAGALSRYQKARGIDTSNRIRIQ